MSTAPHTIAEIEGQILHLLPERAIFWPAQGALLIADLHIGKVSHFRKNGLAVPNKAEQNNLWRLSGILNAWQPEKVVFLGDLFHSRMNAAWDQFADFLGNFEGVQMILVKGNHDILPGHTFENAGIRVVDSLELGPFLLTHDRVETEQYNIHGHVHPAVRLKGQGRQRLRLPCFYFSEAFGILPSFGDFTGAHTIGVKNTDRVYACAGAEVIALNA